MKTIIALTSVIALSVTPAAMAQSDFAYEFNFKKSELVTPGGSEAVYERLENSVKKACEIKGVRGLQYKRIERECEASTMATALEKIGSTALADIHKSVTKVG